MKILFTLITSLALATVFGLLLVKTGVLEFHSGEAIDKLKPLAKTALSKATNALPDFTPEGDATPSLPKVPLPSQAEQQDSFIEDTEATMPPENDHGADIHSKALDFLVGFSGQDASCIEDRFVQFLTRELGLESRCMVSGQNLYVFAQVGRAPTKENLSIPFPNPFSETVEQFSIARIKASHTNIGSIDLMSSGSKTIGRLDRLTDMKLLPLKEYEEKLPENVTKAILRVIAQSLRDAKIIGQIDKKDKLVRRWLRYHYRF